MVLHIRFWVIVEGNCQEVFTTNVIITSVFLKYNHADSRLNLTLDNRAVQ